MNNLPARQLAAAGEDSWKKQLADAIHSPADLLQQLGLTAQSVDTLYNPGFRLRVPHAYVARMRYGDAGDPLLRQVLPVSRENSPAGLLDPVGDLASMPVNGLLHKYAGRVLLVTTGACAIHCRYCFRRHYPYGDASINPVQWQPALDYIARHTDINEVILSGGDPLVIDDHKLAALCRALEQIGHVRWLRIHTRLPVVLPARVNDALLGWIGRLRLRVTIVIHSNHPNELTEPEHRALQRLQQAGVTLLNQSVLLKGINDDADTLVALSRRLHDFGVIPYYLHLLDPVQGALHFDVRQAEAVDIIERMRRRLPGFLVPRLVREVAGMDAKTAIAGI